jgi:hypothetical protein
VWAKKFTLRPLASTSTSVPIAGVKSQMCVSNSMRTIAHPSLPLDKSCGVLVPESTVGLLHVRLCIGVEHLDTRGPPSFPSLLGPTAVLFRSCNIWHTRRFSSFQGVLRVSSSPEILGVNLSRRVTDISLTGESGFFCSSSNNFFTLFQVWFAIRILVFHSLRSLALDLVVCFPLLQSKHRHTLSTSNSNLIRCEQHRVFFYCAPIIRQYIPTT